MAKGKARMTPEQERWLECCLEADRTGRDCFEFHDGELYAVIVQRKDRREVTLVRRPENAPLCCTAIDKSGVPARFEDKVTGQSFDLETPRKA